MMSHKQAHTDINAGGLLFRLLPPQTHPYAKLMRLDRPIGTWLLLWPCWWSATLASQGWPDPYLLVLFAVGAIVMRGAGCVVNDLWDRHIDAKVGRTATRPLPSGEVSVSHALIFLGVLLFIGLLVLLQFNAFTIKLGMASLLLVVTYPLAKRVTWWPQFVLGLAFNWGALMGWAAIHASLSLPAVLLYIAGIFWTLGYDTIYAHQDMEDDQAVGIKSLAIYLGKHARSVIALFYTLTFFLIGSAGATSNISLAFYVILPAALVHCVWQLIAWKPKSPASSLQIFRSNRDFGAIVFLAILAGRITG